MSGQEALPRVARLAIDRCPGIPFGGILIRFLLEPLQKIAADPPEGGECRGIAREVAADNGRVGEPRGRQLGWKSRSLQKRLGGERCRGIVHCSLPSWCPPPLQRSAIAGQRDRRVAAGPCSQYRSLAPAGDEGEIKWRTKSPYSAHGRAPWLKWPRWSPIGFRRLPMRPRRCLPMRRRRRDGSPKRGGC